jgi:hypothetical protein
MRRFVDANGAEWDVVAGRESWGTLCALFVPVRRPGAPVRQTVLPGSGTETAELAIDEMTDDALHELLQRSTIKES